MADVLIAAWALFVLAVAGRGLRRVRSLADVPPLDPTSAPRVTVVVAARDEARHIGGALHSLLGACLPDWEVIVVDDRSTDDTAAIAQRLAERDPRVAVISIRDLPDGWLGKTHALHVGAARATGEYLLFTDADVHFDRLAIRRALTHMLVRQLDHLAVVPELVSPSHWLRWLVGGFSLFAVLYARPWDVGHPRRRAAVGVGAFNMVRTATYRAAGGHEPIRLRPDDDLMLARLLRSRGASADALMGKGTLFVEWYQTLGDLVRGVEKNAFAVFQYRLSLAAAAVAGMLLHTAMFVTPFVLSGSHRLTAVVALALVVAVAARAARAFGQPAWCGLLLPFVTLFFAWASARAVALTLWRGGIYWRGTFYGLPELRRATASGLRATGR